MSYPINGKDPYQGSQPVDKVDLPELNLGDVDFAEIEKKASIFTQGAKFTPVDESVKLVSVEGDGKLIYEDEGEMHLVDSQQELAEIKNKDDNSIKGFFGGFFGNSKSMFSKKNDDLA